MGAFEPVAEFVGRHVDEGVEFAVRIISMGFRWKGVVVLGGGGEYSMTVSLDLTILVRLFCSVLFYSGLWYGRL